MKTLRLISVLAVLSVPSWATWTVVQFSVASAACGTTSATCTITATAIGAGHIGVVGMGANLTGQSLTGVSAGTATWVHGPSCLANGTTKSSDCYYTLSTSSGATSVVATRNITTSSVWEITFAELACTNTPCTLDTSNFALNTVNSTTPPGVALTLSGTNDAIFQGIDGAGISGIASPYSTYFASRGAVGVGISINTSSGTAPTWSQTTNGMSVVSGIAFKEAGSNVGYVGGISDTGQTANPMTVTYTPTAGNAVLVLYQFCDNVTFTSVTATGDTFTNFSHSPFHESIGGIYLGAALALSVAGGSTTFDVHMSGAPSCWGIVNVIELSSVGGIDCAPSGDLVTNTGAANSTNTGSPACATAYPFEMVIGYAGSDNGEISNGSGTGCCLSGWTVATGSGMAASGGGDLGAGLEYQINSATGSVAAQFADTVANDDMGIMTFSVYASGQSLSAVPGFNKRRKLARYGITTAIIPW